VASTRFKIFSNSLPTLQPVSHSVAEEEIEIERLKHKTNINVINFNLHVIEHRKRWVVSLRNKKKFKKKERKIKKNSWEFFLPCHVEQSESVLQQIISNQTQMDVNICTNITANDFN
jgi:hypothetical protein